MQTKLPNEAQGQRTCSVILAKRDEVIPAPNEFVKSQRIGAAQFNAIGAF